MSTFDEYTDMYSLHFSKRLYDFAVSMMTDRNGAKLQPMDKDKVSDFLRTNNVTLKNDRGYDAAYVLSMAKADYWGSSITDDAHLAKFVKDYLDDPDGSRTKAFDHFIVDCRAKGEPIFWDEML